MLQRLMVNHLHANPWSWVQRKAESDFTLLGLKLIIIGWAIFIILLALFVNNKWALGGIIAYEVLP